MREPQRTLDLREVEHSLCACVTRTHSPAFGNEEIGRALEGHVGNQQLLPDSTELLVRATERKVVLQADGTVYREI